MDLLQSVKNLAGALDEKFGKDIVVLDIGKISVIADYFVITTGGNPNQIRALAEAAEESLLKQEIHARHIEGLQSANWVLMDFGDIVVHIFDTESRNFYNLERVWGDATVITV